MAIRASSKVQTFTIGFPGYGKLDETEHARLISRHFGTHHTELMAHDVNADIIPKLAHQFDEPIADSSMIPTFLVSQMVRQYCTVALGGDGGDELFGGYEHYSRILRIRQFQELVPSFLRKGIASTAEKFLPVGFKGRNWIRGLNVNIEKGVQMIPPYFDISSRSHLMRGYSRWPFVAESYMQDRVPADSNLLQRSMRMDFSNYLAEDILVKVDRASMLNSLEIRAPFLDFRLIDFAFSKVPNSLKAKKKEKKILLKMLAARVLPPEFDRQRKQGFSVPLGSWLKIGTFKNLFNEILRDPKCSFNPKTVDQLLHGQEMGRSNGERLFALVLFEIWRRDYGVSF
jgi:asparagine synthase (glutamine-hydrolysing)